MTEKHELVGKYVRHIATGRLGRMITVFSPGEYIDENGNAMPDRIAKLDNGDAFLWPSDQETFEELTQTEVQFYSVTRQAIRQATGELATFAAAHNLDMHKSIDAIIQTLTEAAYALRKTPDEAPEGFSAVSADRISHCPTCKGTFLDAPENAVCPKCKDGLVSGPSLTA